MIPQYSQTLSVCNKCTEIMLILVIAFYAHVLLLTIMGIVELGKTLASLSEVITQQ